MPHPAFHPYRLSRRQSSFADLTRALPLLTIALLVLASAPLHAQQRTAVRKVPPNYPAIARQMGITGTIIVTATVDPSGKVVKAESNSGNKVLAGAAIDAVKQWKFTPGDTTDSFPVTINFEKE